MKQPRLRHASFRLLLGSLSVLAMVLCAVSGCARVSRATTSTTGASGATQRDFTASLQVNGMARSYVVHLPVGYDGNHALPLVLVFHGGGGSGSGMNGLTHFNAVADQNEFIVVYPDGYQQHWADGRVSSPADRDGVDDLAFINTLLDQLEATLKIDTTRVYAAGISNGGFFSARLGCELSSRIAAIGVDAATMATDEAPHCQFSHPVSMTLIHGTADPIVPTNGGSVTIGEPGSILSVDAAVATWVQLDGCGTTPQIAELPNTADDGTSIQQQTYSGCAQGAQVVDDVVDGGGHTWPGGLQYLPVAVVGKTSRNMDASVALWQFFQAHPMPA